MFFLAKIWHLIKLVCLLNTLSVRFFVTSCGWHGITAKFDKLTQTFEHFLFLSWFTALNWYWYWQGGRWCASLLRWFWWASLRDGGQGHAANPLYRLHIFSELQEGIGGNPVHFLHVVIELLEGGASVKGWAEKRALGDEGRVSSKVLVGGVRGGGDSTICLIGLP